MTGEHTQPTCKCQYSGDCSKNENDLEGGQLGHSECNLFVVRFCKKQYKQEYIRNLFSRSRRRCPASARAAPKLSSKLSCNGNSNKRQENSTFHLLLLLSVLDLKQPPSPSRIRFGDPAAASTILHMIQNTRLRRLIEFRHCAMSRKQSKNCSLSALRHIR